MTIVEVWEFIREGGIPAVLFLLIIALLAGKVRLDREVKDREAVCEARLIDKEKVIVMQQAIIDKQNAKMDEMINTVKAAAVVAADAMAVLKAKESKSQRRG